MNRETIVAKEEASILGHRLFEDIFDSSSNGLLLLDSGFHILRAGKGLCQLLGYEQHELFGKQIRKIIAPDAWASALARLEDFSRSDEEAFSTEQQYAQREGSIVWVISAASKLSGSRNPGMPT